MILQKFKFFLVIGTMLGLVMLPAWAGHITNNDEGDKDGKYTVILEDNSTKERSEPYPAKIEGNFLTVFYPDGEIVYKINDMYDRRTELEASVYDNKTKRYKTAHLDDHSHIFHKEKNAEVKNKGVQSSRSSVQDKDRGNDVSSSDNKTTKNKKPSKTVTSSSSKSKQQKETKSTSSYSGMPSFYPELNQLGDY